MDKVKQQLILYCGVMFGVSGAGATLKLATAALAQQTLKKLPQKALTKTIYYPMIKKILWYFGVKLNKDIFAKGVATAIPIVGGVVNGGMTLATMRPMGMRLINEFDDVSFDYTEEDYNNDLNEVAEIIDIEENIDTEENSEINTDSNKTNASVSNDFVFKIKEAKSLFDEGLITEEEFIEIKGKIIRNM